MSAPGTKKYIFDANCFIEPWNKFYSYDFFKPYWDVFVRKSFKEGVILVQREIYDEILKKEDKLSQWLKSSNCSLVETDLELAREVAQINNEFSTLVKESRGRSLADPFVIALAKKEKAVVVTMEDRGTESKPKIPYVCHALGIKCIDLYDFIKESNTEFNLK